MVYKTFDPCIELSGIVKCFWVFEGTATKSNPFTLRTMASGFPELIFHYKGIFSEVQSNIENTPSFTSGIHGQTNKFRDFVVTEDFGMIGIHLFPYAVEPLFNISSIELLDEQLELGLIKKLYQSDLEFQIFQAKNNIERISIISKFIIANLTQTPNRIVVYSVNKIIETNGIVDVKSLSLNCCLSHRQFERIFRESVGFSAKHFSRLVRFNNVLKTRHTCESLTQLSMNLGYYDQSHFIHEFKEFSGNTPNEYFGIASN